MSGTTEHAWAVCSDWHIHVTGIERKRSDAILEFMNFVGEPRGNWNKWRRNGWRCSRVQINELTFGKE